MAGGFEDFSKYQESNQRMRFAEDEHDVIMKQRRRQMQDDAELHQARMMQKWAEMARDFSEEDLAKGERLRALVTGETSVYHLDKRSKNRRANKPQKNNQATP